MLGSMKRESSPVRSAIQAGICCPVQDLLSLFIERASKREAMETHQREQAFAAGYSSGTSPKLRPSLVSFVPFAGLGNFDQHLA